VPVPQLILFDGFTHGLPPAGEVARRAAEQRQATDAANQEPDRP
jgi:hypothetical protein